jgi:hypothetical protein
MVYMVYDCVYYCDTCYIQHTAYSIQQSGISSTYTPACRQLAGGCGDSTCSLSLSRRRLRYMYIGVVSMYIQYDYVYCCDTCCIQHTAYSIPCAKCTQKTRERRWPSEPWSARVLPASRSTYVCVSVMYNMYHINRHNYTN